MPQHEIDLSIIIPTRNDADLIGQVLERIETAAKSLGCSYEIVVVDSASSDQTRRYAEDKGARIIPLAYYPPYGDIVKTGFKEARGEYIIWVEAALLSDYQIIKDFWKERHTGELIIGSRYIEGGTALMPLPRKLMSRLLNRFYGMFLSLPFKDISSGFRMINTKIFEDVEVDSPDYAILIESILKAHACGWIVKEIPFRFEPERFSMSTKRVFSFLLTYLRSIIRMWKLRNSVFSADYDERAYNSIVPLQRYWQRTRYRIIMSFVEQGGQILDIGCGSSRIIQQLQGAVGLDITLKKLRYLRGGGNRLARGDINRLPFKSDVFSLIICSQVIEHVAFSLEIFSEINRVMRPGGILIIGTPDYAHLTWRVIEFFYGKLMPGAYADQHITHFTREGLERTLSDSGFQILEYRYIGRSELIIKAQKTNETKVK